MTTKLETDVAIVGGGAAGLSIALALAKTHQVTIIAKGALTEGSSLYAQGGIAAVYGGNRDSIASHIEDTMNAGAGLCHRDTVEFVVRHGAEAIQWLIQQGVAFSMENNDQYHLTREGGHQHRRVFHATDATGRAISTTLADQVRAHPNIRILEQHISVDLITRKKLGQTGKNHCLGMYIFDKIRERVSVISSRITVLATGGTAKVYLYTSNPDTSTGDGIAMAWRVGCRVANMEFVQFHPTCLYHPQAKSFLISEAVRGEGGRLLLPDGSPFMHRHDPRGELAPRDIVARAIDYEIKRAGIDCVYLDISHKSAEFIKTHFPTIFERCLHFGVDITQEPIPVVPAAHYTCGGVVTDTDGQTDLSGLFAIGECAFTGLHGANRLASNSLLECVVYAQAAAKRINKLLKTTKYKHCPLPKWDESRVTDADEQVVVSHNWDELRRFMWDYVGIVRTNKRLQRAQHRVNLLSEEIREYYQHFKVSNDLIELRNLVLVASLIIACANTRKESRGLHFIRDYPQLDSHQPPHDTVLSPDTEQGLTLLANA